MIRTFQLILFSFLIIGVTACSTVTPPAGPSPTLKPTSLNREQALKQIQSWQINGKLAVHTTKDAGSAIVNWTQHQQQYAISLVGPLGAGAMKLTGRPGYVALDMADGKHFTAQSPEQLLAERWGFHLPVSYLRYWVRGLPVPNQPANPTYDSEHRITTLSQQGFHVQFASYTRVGEVDLPNKIVITSPALDTKMVIYQWKVL